MPDTITVKDTGAKFAPHPEGQYAALCVDTIDLGERVESFPGKPPKCSAKCVIAFWTGEENPDTGERLLVHAEFTVSMNERAGLRKFLEDWRGKSYREEEAKSGVPLHKLVGVPALISIEHKTSANNRRYAKIKSIQPLPKAMQPLPFDGLDYERAEFWAERKASYRAEVARYRAESGASGDDYAEHENGDGDDLPF